MTQINPHINFNGNAEEADKFGIEWMVDFDPNYKGYLLSKRYLA